MPLELPEENEPRSRRLKTPPMVQHDALSPEDTIEYGITLEVSRTRGQKAWIKLGTTSSVREGETTSDAERRVFTWVEDTLDRRLDELADE